MRAWRVHELGEPASVLRLEEVPDPQAGAGEVVVRGGGDELHQPTRGLPEWRAGSAEQVELHRHGGGQGPHADLGGVGAGGDDAVEVAGRIGLEPAVLKGPRAGHGPRDCAGVEIDGGDFAAGVADHKCAITGAPRDGRRVATADLVLPPEFLACLSIDGDGDAGLRGVVGR